MDGSHASELRSSTSSEAGWGQRQFLIERAAATEGGAPNVVGGFKLQAHSTLPVQRLIDERGETIGWILGWVIDLRARKIVDAPLRLSMRGADNVAREGVIEDTLDRLHGTFLLVICLPSFSRIYSCIYGNLGCVFCADAKSAASTAVALFDDAERSARLDPALAGAIDFSFDKRFGFDLTPHRGVRRLMPNHYLDLDNWTQHRHWPLAPIEPAPDGEGVIQALKWVADGVLSTLPADRILRVPLTAGRDSRMVLAAMRPYADRIKAFTFTGERIVAPIDAIFAKRIAARAEVDHEIIPARFATPEAAAQWIARTGSVIAGSNAYLHEAMRPLAENSVFFPGPGGTVGRAYMWTPADRPDSRASAANMAARASQPITAPFIDAADRWLEGLKHVDFLTKLDLLFLECYFARGAEIYGPDFYYDDVCLLLHPRIQRSMIALPAEYRRKKRIASDFVERFWPELNEFPYNSYKGVEQLAYLAKKATDPDRLWRHARRLLTR